MNSPLSTIEIDVLTALAAPGVRPLTQRDLYDRTRHDWGALAGACRQLRRLGLADRQTPRPAVFTYTITDVGRQELAAATAQLRLAS